MSQVAIDFNAGTKNPAPQRIFVVRGRIPNSTVDALEEENLREILATYIKGEQVSITAWDPHIGRFINSEPDVRGAFIKPSEDPKFSKRNILTPDESHLLMSSMPGGHFIIPFAISGKNLNERVMQLFELCGLIKTQTKGHYTLDIILTKPYGDRNDKEHIRDGHNIHNALTIANFCDLISNTFKPSRLYLCEPHSFSAMRLARQNFQGEVNFPSFAPALAAEVKKYLLDQGLGQKLQISNIAVHAPDGGLKHLIGSAHFIGYLRARGHDVSCPVKKNDNLSKRIFSAYQEALDYYNTNQNVSFDYDLHSGPQASIERAWKTYLSLHEKPVETPLPLRLDDFPEDFILFDKVRKSDTEISKLELIHGKIKNKVLISVDDISATGGTQIACANVAYTLGAQNFIPVLMHGGFVEFTDEKDMKKYQDCNNALEYMLAQKHPKKRETNLFPVILFSNSAPSAEDYKTDFLADHGHMHDRVRIIDVTNVMVECVTDAILKKCGLKPNGLVLLKLPEDNHQPPERSRIHLTPQVC